MLDSISTFNDNPMYVGMHEISVEKQGPDLLHEFTFEKRNKVYRCNSRK